MADRSDTETTNLLSKSPEKPESTVTAPFNRSGNHGYGRYGASAQAAPPVARVTERAVSITGANDAITLSWSNVNAYVKAQKKCCKKIDHGDIKQILKDVSGRVAPGTLLAIMGASGSGKSTLLNVLNQRNTEDLLVERDLRVNGTRIGRAITALSAYVQQDDLFVGTLTVREHLWFQAMLRMDKHYSNKVRLSRIEEVISELGLTSCSTTMIGNPGVKTGISGGEKKRLAFASEVLTNPALLFCDEPTSGLDSFMAESVVLTLKDLAAKGKTVVCTIHQPSSEVYALFDTVLLLADGRTAYMGEAKGALPFFESVGYPCPPAFNPADHFIHTLAIVPGKEETCKQRVEKIADTYTASASFDEMMEQVNEDNARGEHDRDLTTEFRSRSPYKASWWRQFRVVLWRAWITMVREPLVARSRIAQSVLVALLFGLIYLQQPLNQKGVMNINGALFLLQAQVSFGNLFAVINTFCSEFPIFKREHHNGMYRVDVYYLTKILAELPLFVITSIVFSSIAYWMMGLYADFVTFVICSCVLILVTLVATSYGYVISSATSNVKLATAISPMIVIPMMLFGGFFLNSATVPVYFIWLKYISWFNYGNEILVVNQWKNIHNISCEYLPHHNTSFEAGSSGAATNRCFPNGQAVIESLGFHQDNVVFDLIILAVLSVAFRFVSYLLILIRVRKRS